MNPSTLIITYFNTKIDKKQWRFYLFKNVHYADNDNRL